jgi:hypothetical protein
MIFEKISGHDRQGKDNRPESAEFVNRTLINDLGSGMLGGIAWM